MKQYSINDFFCLRADSQEAFAHWELFEGTFIFVFLNYLLSYIHPVQ